MTEGKEYTMKEAAKLLRVSTQTIKRRIDKGELMARKEITSLGERWLIPANQLNIATQEIDVIPLNRQIGLYEIQRAISTVLATQTQEIQSHIERLEEKIDAQAQILEGQAQMLEGHYRLVDERLRQSIEEKKERPKPFWKRLF